MSMDKKVKYTIIGAIVLGFYFFIIYPVIERQVDEVIENSNKYYTEKSLSFYDPYDFDVDFTSSTWIRSPENIRTAHETFKKIGYFNLIDSSSIGNNPCMLWSYVKMPCNVIMDSLLLTYNLDTVPSKYYREFWNRRKKEHNAEAVYDVLTEVVAILQNKVDIEYNNELVNDTLYNLLLIERVNTNPTNEQARKDFNFLKDIGLHASAFNLLYESSSYQDVDWNKSELAKQLNSDTSNCCPWPWVMDDTK